MADPSATVAHIAKFSTGLICMRYFADPFSIIVYDHQWATRAFQLLLIHSVLGILRFGSPRPSTYLLRSYTWLTKIISTVPFALIVMEILVAYKTSEQITLTLLILTFFPIVSESRSKERTRQHLNDVSVGFNLCALIYVALKNNNYPGLSLAASNAFAYFFLDKLADRYDVPHKDLSQSSFTGHNFLPIRGRALIPTDLDSL